MGPSSINTADKETMPELSSEIQKLKIFKLFVSDLDSVDQHWGSQIGT